MRSFALLLVAIGVGSCGSSGSSEGGGSPVEQQIAADLEQAARRATFLVESVGVTTLESAEPSTLEALARRVVEASALLLPDARGPERIVRPYESAENSVVQEFLAAGLLTAGDRVLEVRWRLTDGTEVTTLATATEAGRLKYEPILYFSPSLEVEPVHVDVGSWTATHKARIVRAGPGSSSLECVAVEWKVHIETDVCSITNPAPRVPTATCTATCFGYSAACTQGETEYCRENAECPACDDYPNGEQCIRYALQLVVTTGGVELVTEPDPGGFENADISGVPVADRIQARHPERGQVIRKVILGDLCALTGGVPKPDGEIALQFEDQILYTNNQRSAIVHLGHDPGDCDCSRVVFAQTIQIEGSPPRIDVDPTVTGVETPFYNYDPLTGGPVPRPRLGMPGDCSGSRDASLRDEPLQTNANVTWEVCAICCDDGRILDCRKWRYDTTIDRNFEVEGEKKFGAFVDDGPIDTMSAEARAAYIAGIEAYVAKHPRASTDPCVIRFLITLDAMGK